MIAIPTAIVASVSGAVVAGVISALVNAFSLRRQSQQNRKHKEWIEQFQWRRETNAIVRQLRREVLQMDIDDPDIEVISELIEDLEIQLDIIPQDYNGTQLDNALNDIRLAHHDYENGDGDVVELRTEMLRSTETAEREIEDIS